MPLRRSVAPLCRAAARTPLHEALCDAHDPSAVALRHQDRIGADMQELTYGVLADRSRRLARALKEGAGVREGDVVAVMLPKGPRVLEAAVALARLGAVYQPLFTAFQPEGIRARVGPSGAKVVITDADNRTKLDSVYTTSEVNVVCAGGDRAGDLEYDTCAVATPPLDDAAHAGLSGMAPMALLYSSGTTGPPKGIVCPVDALRSFKVYLEQGIGLLPDNRDRYWNIADSGWAYGLYYNVYAPLYTGQSTHVLSAPFDPEATLRFMAEHEITSFAAAPTVYRALRALPDSAVRPHAERMQLRAACSAGEPLPPPVTQWFEATFGVPILNHYGQTEVGMMVNQHRAGARKRREGGDTTAMGVPMEGFDGACVLDAHGEKVTHDGGEGELCMKVDESPLFWFRGYAHAPGVYTDDAGYYHTGDRVRVERTADGHVEWTYLSRDDDVITSAGYRVGPAEVESAILKLPFVAEVGVVGVPDEMKGEAVKAFVVLKEPLASQTEDDLDALAVQVKDHVRASLAKHIVPREVTFIEALPKTESGKVKRFVLRQGYP